ncbi:hypothetical protein AB0G71_05245 [Streptomyces sp. NPDC020403]|uniref:hypothetical protein n=1 Tax=unclassified Streptomyces TaxID=2593676 RepID=UPI0033F730B8
MVHAFREGVGRAPDRTALACSDGRLGHRDADGLPDSAAGRLAAGGLRRGVPDACRGETVRA